jgi:hypothetical protein
MATPTARPTRSVSNKSKAPSPAQQEASAIADKAYDAKLADAIPGIAKPTADYQDPAPASTPKLAEAPKKAKSPKAPVVKDHSGDTPNKPIESYRNPREGALYIGSGGKMITRRDSGVNRFAILIARPGGCTEAEGRHVNPRGYEYSGSFAGYVASNTGVSIIVKDGRYQVAGRVAGGGYALDEEVREGVFEALGGDTYLEQTVNFIRSNPKYDYSGFTLSKGAALVAA